MKSYGPWFCRSFETKFPINVIKIFCAFPILFAWQGNMHACSTFILIAKLSAHFHGYNFWTHFRIKYFYKLSICHNCGEKVKIFKFNKLSNKTHHHFYISAEFRIILMASNKVIQPSITFSRKNIQVVSLESSYWMQISCITLVRWLLAKFITDYQPPD